MKSLYEISTELMTLLSEIDNAGGEITESQELQLVISEKELKQKAVAYVSVIKTFEGESLVIENEINRLQALKKHRDKIVSKLKETIKNALIQFNIEQIKTELININFRSSKSLEITDIEKLPNDCIIWEKKAISKIELRKRIESGENIPGCELVKNINLQIK